MNPIRFDKKKPSLYIINRNYYSLKGFSMIVEHTKLLIIGAGVHGMTLAISYMEQGGCLEDLIIVDRLTDPLSNWKQQTSSISMSHLRSTRVHHDSWSVRKSRLWRTRSRSKNPPPTSSHTKKRLTMMVRRLLAYSSNEAFAFFTTSAIALRLKRRSD